MKLTSDFVGAALKEHTCRIGARQTMNYAAAIGDPNPLYFNDERPEGIIAPPLFPVAMTWPIIENISDYIEAEGFPREILFTQVHYTEHLSIHRPVTPGGNVTIRGSIAAILPHKAGTHVVIRFDATDTGWKSSVYRAYRRHDEGNPVRGQRERNRTASRRPPPTGGIRGIVGIHHTH